MTVGDQQQSGREQNQQQQVEIPHAPKPVEFEKLSLTEFRVEVRPEYEAKAREDDEKKQSKLNLDCFFCKLNMDCY